MAESMEGRGRVLHLALRGADGSICTIDPAVAGHSIGPRGLIEGELEWGSKGDERLLPAEVIGLWRGLHLLERCLLLRVGGKRVLVRLISGRPEGRAQRDRIVVERGEFQSAVSARR